MAIPAFRVYRQLPNGHSVMRQRGDAVYFRGTGATMKGTAPSWTCGAMVSGETERLFRSAPDRYEYFVAFAGDDDRLVMSSESAADVPNYYVATLGDPIEATEGEATRALTSEPITHFEDPAPWLAPDRQADRALPARRRTAPQLPAAAAARLPGGHAAAHGALRLSAGILRGWPPPARSGARRGASCASTGRSHLFFLLRGYAVLDQTAMPMLGDPETAYDTFVPQLVADAEAAVAKAVEMGVADPERIGVIGHSHGGLMVANLLAHTDLFRAGIARSGSYNKTVQPFGFQSERRFLFEARNVYIQVSPTFFADQVDEPVLIIHGLDDSNPGTRTPQSEVFFEGVRGSGGTARLVLLPFEDHGYRGRESIEHVLWEQLRWFDMYLKGAGTATSQGSHTGLVP